MRYRRINSGRKLRDKCLLFIFIVSPILNCG